MPCGSPQKDRHLTISQLQGFQRCWLQRSREQSDGTQRLRRRKGKAEKVQFHSTAGTELLRSPHSRKMPVHRDVCSSRAERVHMHMRLCTVSKDQENPKGHGPECHGIQDPPGVDSDSCPEEPGSKSMLRCA